MVVTDLLLESFNDIFDVKYTARMEEELDEIEEGKLDWRAAMGEFYERFDKDLKHAEEHMTDIKRMEKPTDLMCEKCGKPLVIKWGKHGSFIACTGYPDFSSKSTESDLEKLQKDIAVRTGARASRRSTRTVAKLQTRYPQYCVHVGATSGEFVRQSPPRRNSAKALQNDAEETRERHRRYARLKDRAKIEVRLEKIQARYPQMKDFYDLELTGHRRGRGAGSGAERKISAPTPAN